MAHAKPTRRYHRIDGWRGYYIPKLAIVGSSDTGTWADSPCPTPDVMKEIRRFRKEVLKPAGIKSRCSLGNSSNLFCGKRWVCVPEEDFERAAQLATNWLDKHDRSTHYIHSADLDSLGYKPENENGN